MMALTLIGSNIASPIMALTLIGSNIASQMMALTLIGSNIASPMMALTLIGSNIASPMMALTLMDGSQMVKCCANHSKFKPYNRAISAYMRKWNLLFSLFPLRGEVKMSMC